MPWCHVQKKLPPLLLNRVNALADIPHDMEDKARNLVASSLNIDAESVPDGLILAVNEQFRIHGLQTVGSTLSPLLNPGCPPIPDHSILRGINLGLPSLVMKPKASSSIALVKNVCATFHESRVVIAVSTRREGVEVVNALRAEGQACWYLDKEYPVYEGQDAPFHRIRVVRSDMLWLISLDLNAANIFIATDASSFVRTNSQDLDLLFNIGFGTHFHEEVRLVGILNEDASKSEFSHVFPIFGLKSHLLYPSGEAFLAPLVTWVSRRKHEDKGLAREARTEIPNREWMETLVWNNVSRNRCVIKLAARLAGQSNSLYPAGPGCGDECKNSVGIVVENNRHRDSVQALQQAQAKAIPVFTFDEIRRCNTLPSKLVRADAGTGLMPLSTLGQCVRVYDIRDEAHWYLRRRFKQRDAAYSLLWHSGPRPFTRKWNFALRRKHSS